MKLCCRHSRHNPLKHTPTHTHAPRHTHTARCLLFVCDFWVKFYSNLFAQLLLSARQSEARRVCVCGGVSAGVWEVGVALGGGSLSASLQFSCASALIATICMAHSKACLTESCLCLSSSACATSSLFIYDYFIIYVCVCVRAWSLKLQSLSCVCACLWLMAAPHQAELS